MRRVCTYMASCLHLSPRPFIIRHLDLVMHVVLYVFIVSTDLYFSLSFCIRLFIDLLAYSHLNTMHCIDKQLQIIVIHDCYLLLILFIIYICYNTNSAHTIHVMTNLCGSWWWWWWNIKFIKCVSIIAVRCCTTNLNRISRKWCMELFKDEGHEGW